MSMGLIKAFTGAGGGVLTDQWKDYFYRDALDQNTLMVKGGKRVSGRGSNTKATENIIARGSVFAGDFGESLQGRALHARCLKRLPSASAGDQWSPLRNEMD